MIKEVRKIIQGIKRNRKYSLNNDDETYIENGTNTAENTRNKKHL